MGSFRVEHSTDADDKHYATLICGDRIVIRIPLSQERIEAAEASLKGLTPAEALMSQMLGGDLASKAVLEDAADAAIAIHLGATMRYAESMISELPPKEQRG